MGARHGVRKNERAILRRTAKPMMRVTCGVKLIEKRKSQELVNLLGLNNTLDGPARGYENVLRKYNGDVLKRALDFKAAGKKGHG